MNLDTLGSLATLGLAFAAIAGAVVAYFRVGLSKSTIETLKESNAALNERVGDLRTEQVTTATRLSAVESENAVLRDALSAKIDVSAILELVGRHHAVTVATAEAFDGRFTAAMIDVSDRLTSNKRAIDDVLAIIGHRRNEARV